MKEEEKQAIEELKEDIKDMEENEEIIHVPLFKYEAKILLNLIEKLQKEIENLKDKYILEKVAKEEVEELLENSISKDRIKNKIKEKQDKIKKLHSASDCVIIDDLENEINVLKELLGDE